MRAWFVVVAIVAGCRAPVAEPLAPPMVEPPPPPPRAHPRATASVERPALVLSYLIPDFREELRWPLSPMTHPELAPAFDIASEFAEPGIGWIELCRRGVHERVTAHRDRDQLAYLRGWCATLQGDVDRASAQLAPLVRSPVLGLPAAVRIDLANILASTHSADKAEHYLSRHDIRDIPVLDMLAAMFLELGDDAAAYEINRRAMGSDRHATKATACRRMVRHIVLGPEADRTLGIEQLRAYIQDPRRADAACLRMYNAIRCWSGATERCRDYLTDQRMDPRYADLLELYERWPQRAVGFRQWFSIADRALVASDLPGADELAITAFEAAVRAAGMCKYDLAYRLREVEPLLRVRPPIAERVAALLDRCSHVPPRKGR